MMSMIVGIFLRPAYRLPTDSQRAKGVRPRVLRFAVGQTKRIAASLGLGGSYRDVYLPQIRSGGEHGL